MESSVADYGDIIAEIVSTKDELQLQKLADEYMERYQRLAEICRYSSDEERALSDFFCECDAYSPADDEIWTTEDANTCINGAQMRKAASCTLQKLRG